MKLFLMTLYLPLVVMACVSSQVGNNDDVNQPGAKPLKTQPTSVSSAPEKAEASSRPSSGGAIASDMQAVVDKSRSDLGGKLGVATGTIQVMLAERVVWRDTALGCASPEGGFFAQVLTKGSRVHLSVEDKTFAYHAGPDDKPFLCEHPQSPLPAAKGELE